MGKRFDGRNDSSLLGHILLGNKKFFSSAKVILSTLQGVIKNENVDKSNFRTVI
jgi:hypothetical protein